MEIPPVTAFSISESSLVVVLVYGSFSSPDRSPSEHERMSIGRISGSFVVEATTVSDGCFGPISMKSSLSRPFEHAIFHPNSIAYSLVDDVGSVYRHAQRIRTP